MSTRNLTPADLARVLRVAADELDRIASEAATARLDWVSQAESPLGRKRHCAAVRARLAQGRDGAAVVGRRHLLAPHAVAEELQSVSGKKLTTGTEPTADLERKLRLVGGAL